MAFVGDAAHPTAGGWGTGSAFSFGDVWALYRSLHRAHSSRPPTIASAGAATALAKELVPESDGPPPYDVPYALHLYNETRRHFLQRVERQFVYDRRDIAYCVEAIDDYAEYVKRFKERYTVNWWLLEHDVDARWQEAEAEERHMYPDRRKESLANPKAKL